MANPNRSIIIENTNALITYMPDNAWTDVPSSGSGFQTGNLGDPLSVSLKNLGQLGSLSFSFNGSSIDVYGSVINKLDPLILSLNCTVDGMAITPPALNRPLAIPTNFLQNNWPFCSSGNLEPGQHMLLFTVNSSIESAFYFDYLTFVSDSDDQHSNGLIRIDSSDSSIAYSSGWTSQEMITGSTRLSNETGSSAKISFIGQQLSWYGTAFPFASAQAEFSVDGGSPTQFELAGAEPSVNQPLFIQRLLFQTGNLSQGAHEVNVTYLGNNQQTDLSLEFVIVQNASEKIVHPEATTILITPTATISSKSHSGRPLQIGVIAGVIIVLLLIITLTAVFVYKRRRSRHATISEATQAARDASSIVASPTGADMALLYQEPKTSDPYVTPSRSINTQILGMSPDPLSASDSPASSMSPKDRVTSPPLHVPFLPTDPFVDDWCSVLTEPIGTTSDFSGKIPGTSHPIRPIRPLPNPLLGRGTAGGMDNEGTGVRFDNKVLQAEISSLKGSPPIYTRI